LRPWRGAVPPTNVRLVLADGREVPVECVYAGRNRDGIAVWEVVTDLGAGTVCELKADILPAKTAIRFPMKLM